MAVAVMRDSLNSSEHKKEKFKAQVSKKACYKEVYKYGNDFSVITERIAAVPL